MRKNLWNKFKEASSEFDDQIAIQYKEDGLWRDFSFKSLFRKTEALSAFFAKENINENDTVAISMENRPEWVMIFFAAMERGAIVVPINTDLGSEEVLNILSGAECKIAFVGESSVLCEKGLIKRPSSLKKIISVKEETFKLALERVPVDTVLSDVDEDRAACILSTSGTTSAPKGIMLSHGNLLANSNSLFRLGLMRRKDGILAALPLYDAYPLTVTMLLPLFYGGKIIYPGSMCPEEVMAAMRKKNPADFIGVPQVFRMFHRRIVEKLNCIPFVFKPFFIAITELLYGIRKMTGINLSRHLFRKAHLQLGRAMRLFISGGTKLDEKIGRDLFKFGFTILEGYGLTEASPVLAINPFKKPKIGSVGLPLPDVELKLLNKNKDGAGEILARGPNIMKGYCVGSKLTAARTKDEWFHTGDIGVIDKDGYVSILGRLKDVIVFDSGLNVYPNEIEEAYLREVPLKEMCIFEECPQENMELQFLKAAVVPDPIFFEGHNGDTEVIKKVLVEKFRKVSRRLSLHKRINHFFVTFNDLPRTHTGKIKRYEVKEIYADRPGYTSIPFNSTS
ncbi:MAG: AMP-binding protein [Candidatus Omnitrophica bacterium]|nr:AMP-binding protein [Candidatus Omnitrophota bacterium]